MSEEKLKLPQKVFAALERLIRETPVHDLDLGYAVTTDSVDFSLAAAVKAMSYAIPAVIADTPVTITAQPVEIVHQLTHPAIHDAAMDSLTGNVIDEQVEAVHTTTVCDEPLPFATATVIDLFKQYRIDPRRLSAYIRTGDQSRSPASLVKQVDLQPLKPGVHTLAETKLKITAGIKENTDFFKRLTLQKKPVVLSFLSETEQLIYWRQAVLQTKKEPRQMQLVGVYTGIPYDYVENIKVNYSQKSLNYNFKIKSPGRNCELKDIALFNDIAADKIFLVLK